MTGAAKIHTDKSFDSEAALKKRDHFYSKRLRFGFFLGLLGRSRPYLVGLGDLADDLAGGRVDGGEGFAADGLVPLVIDEELQTEGSAGVVTPPRTGPRRRLRPGSTSPRHAPGTKRSPRS